MIHKTCTKCNIKKTVEEFTRKRKGSEVRRSRCKTCENKYVNENRRESLNEYARSNRDKFRGYTYQYEKTINGFLMRAYRNMKSRITGVQKKKFHLYKGKELLPKEDFYEFSRNNKHFLALYKAWKMNNYDMKLTPSVNRVDSNVGYTLDNIEWITHSQNSALSSVTKRLQKQEYQMVKNILGVGIEKK